MYNESKCNKSVFQNGLNICREWSKIELPNLKCSGSEILKKGSFEWRKGTLMPSAKLKERTGKETGFSKLTH